MQNMSLLLYCLRPTILRHKKLLITYEWSDWRNGNFWWLQSLYVDPQYRQQGVFRQLYDYVYGQAQANTEKVCGFRLYVERDNQQAHKAYAHIGFQETAYQMHEIDLLRIPLLRQ